MLVQHILQLFNQEWVWKYVQWIWQFCHAGFVQYMDILNALLMSSKNNLIMVSALQACDITGGIYLKVPHMPSLLQYLLVSDLKNTSMFFVCQLWNIHFTDLIIQEYQRNSQNTSLCPCSGFFSLIKSRDPSLSFHLLFTLTTELPASVIATSLKLATSAPCACQVSL